jgi:heparan sulfate 2-O-sulfotransferase HS2ST1
MSCFKSRIPGSSWAFEQAKNNLIKNYLLVGVTEQMEEFVAVLEATLPNIFKGALKLYRKGKKEKILFSEQLSSFKN